MLVEIPRTDGVGQPVLVPGNPVRMSGAAAVPDGRPPWLGEHTGEVLSAELGLGWRPGKSGASRNGVPVCCRSA